MIRDFSAFVASRVFQAAPDVVRQDGDMGFEEHALVHPRDRERVRSALPIHRQPRVITARTGTSLTAAL